MFVDPLTEFFKHFDGGADLGGSRGLHGDVKFGCRVRVCGRVPVGDMADG
jgi:hypothetical protein